MDLQLTGPARAAALALFSHRSSRRLSLPESIPHHIPLGLALAGLLALSVAAPALGQTGVDFDGANDYVTFGPAPSLGAAQFTLELWFMRQGTGVTTSTGTGGVTAVPLLTKGRGEGDGTNVDCNYFLGIRGTDTSLMSAISSIGCILS